MTLVELLNKANESYPDGSLADYYTPEGREKEGSGDTLAQAIVRELISTFDPETDYDEQLQSAVEAMRGMHMDIDEVIGGLEFEQERRAALCPQCGEGRDVDCYGDYRCVVCDKPCPHH